MGWDGMDLLGKRNKTLRVIFLLPPPVPPSSLLLPSPPPLVKGVLARGRTKVSVQEKKKKKKRIIESFQIVEWKGDGQ
jgi:hypothetical protein